MRILLIIVLSAVVGTAIGASSAYWEARSGLQAITLPEDGTLGAPLADDSAPRVEVDDASFNFGTMQRGTTKSHDFIFTNVGNAPLTLRVGQTSCKCTLGKVDNEPIAPGESVNVRLEWSAKQDGGAFRQTATVLTNDPTRSQVQLTVDGIVTEATGVFPPDLLLDKVSAGGSKSAEVYVMAMVQDELHISSAELSDPNTRDQFDIAIEPVAKEDLPDPAARAGVKITVTAKPGLPVGRFDQWLALETDLVDAERLEIPLIGRVVGDISVYGNGWNEEQGVLALGNVKSNEGKSARLNIVVRGDSAGDVEFEPSSTEPEEIEVSVGEPRKLREDLAHVPITISIPPGTRPMVHLNTAQGDEGRVILKTTHPTIKELVLGVRFAVER